MTKFFLIRHGQDRDNAAGRLNGRRDEPLTEAGIGQAEEIAKKISHAGMQFEAVYTSPLQRCRQTAEIIAKIAHTAPPEILPDLIEREFGIMTGEPIDRIEKLCAPDILKSDTVTYFLNPPGAETFPQLFTRAQSVLAGLSEKHQSGNILLVTHGDFGKMLYAAYYRLDWQQVLRTFHFGNGEMLELSQAS